jgi:hypothetical protein
MNNLFKKYVKITVNLPEGIDKPVVGTLVKNNDETVGEVIAYDKETGKATIRLKSAEWKKIAGNTGLPKNMYINNEQKTIEKFEKEIAQHEEVKRYEKAGTIWENTTLEPSDPPVVKTKTIEPIK